MRKFLISAVVAGGAASLTLLGLSASTIAAHAAPSPEGCIAATQGSSVTDGGYVVIGTLTGSGPAPSSAPSVSANCAYEATAAAQGFSAAGTYKIIYGVGTLSGTSCSFGTNPTTTITDSGGAPTTQVGTPNVAGDCVQVHAGP